MQVWMLNKRLHIFLMGVNPINIKNIRKFEIFVFI